MKAIVIAGSKSDEAFVNKIIAQLEAHDISHEHFFASAHKEPKKVLSILESNMNEKVVYITVAGMSNALSGFVAANSQSPTIACPPFKDQMDMMVNVHSSLQMPSKVPAMTILRPDNCAIAIKRMFLLSASS